MEMVMAVTGILAGEVIEMVVLMPVMMAVIEGDDEVGDYLAALVFGRSYV